MRKEKVIISGLNFKKVGGKFQFWFSDGSYEICLINRKKLIKKNFEEEIEAYLRVNKLIIENWETDRLQLFLEPFIKNSPIYVVIKNVVIKDLEINTESGYIKELKVQNLDGKVSLETFVENFEIDDFSEVFYSISHNKLVNTIRAENGWRFSLVPSVDGPGTHQTLWVKNLEIKNVEIVAISDISINLENGKSSCMKINNCKSFSINSHALIGLPNNYLIETETVNYHDRDKENIENLVDEIRRGRIKTKKVIINFERSVSVNKFLKTYLKK